MHINITKKIIVAIAIMFFVLPLNTVAESGSILISDDNTSQWTLGNGGGGNPLSWTQLNWDTTNYNTILNFRVSPSGASYVYSFESTRFSITSGGTGGGDVWYDRNLSRIQYIFDSTDTFTSNPLYLSYTKNILVNVTGGQTGTGARPSNAHLCFASGTDSNYCAGANIVYSDVHVALRATDYYNTSYFSNFFRVSIDKNAQIDTKYKIQTLSGSGYSEETTFNKVDINNATFEYGDGLVLNATLSNGIYSKTIVNSSSVIPIIITTGIIQYNQSAYTQNSNLNYSWQIANMDTQNGYYAQIYDAQDVLIDSQSITTSTGYNIIDHLSLPLIGTYTLKLIEREGLDTSAILDTDEAYYGSSQQDLNTTVTGNFSIHNSPILQGNNLYITYNISTDGFIDLYDGTNTLRTYVNAGNSQNINITIPDNYHIGISSARLKYVDIFSGLETLLYWQSLIVQSSQAFTLTTEKDNYVQGELIKFYPFSTESGYAKIVSPSGVMVKNISIDASGSHILTFESNINSEVGTYTATLYNSTQLLATKTTYLNYGMQTPTPTATIQTQPTSLIDVTSQLSEGLLGKIDSNSDGLNSNDELSKFGNGILSTLVLIVIALLVVGIFRKR